ncbi:MAG: hypothetical protein V1766_11935 [Pseudomonadota bacterium]
MKNQKIHPANQQPKTGEPQRVVTIALPEKTLNVLEAYDQDLALAIEKVTDQAIQRAFPRGNSYEIVKVAPRKSIFIVGSNTHLSEIKWLKLVEISPGRNLIAIPSGTSLELVEIAILELIETIPPDEARERGLLEEFCKYVGRLRRYKKMSTVEILIVDTDE